MVERGNEEREEMIEKGSIERIEISERELR